MENKKKIVVGVSLVFALLLSACGSFGEGEPEVGENDGNLGLVDNCPVGEKFESSKDSIYRECECPEGYEKDSMIIGGEICYGNAECPILEVECKEI